MIARADGFSTIIPNQVDFELPNRPERMDQPLGETGGMSDGFDPAAPPPPPPASTDGSLGDVVRRLREPVPPDPYDRRVHTASAQERAAFTADLAKTQADAPGFSYGPVLPGAADDGRMPPIDQGSSSACGTASLAMIMGYLGKPTSYETIDRQARRTDFGATPGPLIDYAREHGLAAEGYQNGSWDEMKSFIDRGIPVQALINTQANGNPKNGHFLDVVGFRTDAAGNEQILVRNSADGGGIEAMSRADFEKKWGNHFEYHNFFIAYAPAGTALPPSRWDGIEGVEAVTNGLSNGVNDIDRIIHPDNAGDVVHGVIGAGGAATQILGGAVGGVLQLGGEWLDRKAGAVPVVGVLARPIGRAIDAVGAAVADVSNAIGGAVEHFGGAVGALFRGDFKGFGSGLVDTAKDVWSAVKDPIDDLGKGVGAVLTTVADDIGTGVKAVGKAIAKGAAAVGHAIASFFGF
jgi:hypothetical protein